MSKKMLKRSLALGALMAFVITGSAWAAETLTADKNVNGIVYTDFDGWYDPSGVGTGESTEKEWNLNGNTLTVNKCIDANRAIYVEGFNITGNKNSSLVIQTADEANTYGLMGSGTIDVGTLSINSDSNAITSYYNYFSGNVYYEAGKYEVKEEFEEGTIIKANNIELNSTNGSGIILFGNDNPDDVVTYEMQVKDFTSFKVTAGSYGLSTGQAAEGTIKVTGDNDGKLGIVDITAGETAVLVHNFTAGNLAALNYKNSISIAAQDVIAKSTWQDGDDSKKGYAVCVAKGNGSTIDINATRNVDLEGPNGAIKAVKGGIVNITAGTANFKGKVVAEGTVDLSGIKDLVIKGLTPNADAAIQVAEGGTLKVNNTETGTLAIDGAKAGETYNVVQGVADKKVLWSDANLAYDRTTMVATSALDEKEKLYTVKYESFNDVEDVTDEVKDQFVAAVGGEELAVPGLVAASTGQGSVMKDTAPGAKKFLAAVSSDAEMPKETKAAVINSAAKLAEAGGNAGTAVSVANNVAGVTTGRMSFGGRGHGGHKGGHGVGMFEEGSGAAVWAQYMHGKDDATDMPMDGGATSYESEYDGIVLGVDFKKVGKFQSGIAFNYGEGDSTGFGSGIKTSSEYDFWGVGYYGNIRNEDTNFIFDVNYAKSDSDVTQNNPAAREAIEASPETTTWSAGVKVEKLYQNNNVQIVPYTGLRYMSIDTDEYQSNIGGDTLFNYAPERQDIWLLPLGVTIKQEVVNNNGWVVTPKVDLSYIWAFGDTDSNMSVSIPGIAASNDTLGFTVMDDGSFLGLVGVEAKLDDWTFGVSYSYQKGDYAESKKWFVDAKYSF